MKRTPLRRKRPLRAKPGPPKPRARLAPASAKQAARLEAYRAMVAEARQAGRDACAKCPAKKQTDFHHPWGRGKDNLFRGIFLCRPCHDAIHASPNEALSLGWLQPAYRGQDQASRDWPRPWEAGALIERSKP